MVKFELSARFCIFNSVCVLEDDGKRIVFGMVDSGGNGRSPLREKLVRAANGHFRRIGVENGAVEFVDVDEGVVRKRAALGYGMSDGETPGMDSPSSASDDGASVDESVTVVLLDSILSAAVERGATDVHIEEGCVRFRVSGLLSRYCELSHERNRELVRRVKALSNLDLMESRTGQDGQFSFSSAFGGRERNVSVRVSCLPCVSSSSGRKGGDSESLVLRLLDPERVPLELSSLGFSGGQLSDIEEMASSEFGLLLVCGATGSGKSTTAASILSLIQERNGGGKKIITIEDPPEYVLGGVTQIRVDSRGGLGFADALRFVFRQDPDVVFIGEVRDEETARACVRASLTGHLVVATMHTSGVDEAFSRLRDLGVRESDVSSCVRGIVVQRLSFLDGRAELDADVRSFPSGAFSEPLLFF